MLMLFYLYQTSSVLPIFTEKLSTFNIPQENAAYQNCATNLQKEIAL